MMTIENCSEMFLSFGILLGVQFRVRRRLFFDFFAFLCFGFWLVLFWDCGGGGGGDGEDNSGGGDGDIASTQALNRLVRWF